MSSVTVDNYTLQKQCLDCAQNTSFHVPIFISPNQAGEQFNLRVPLAQSLENHHFSYPNYGLLPKKTVTDKTLQKNHEAWWFSSKERILVNLDKIITLTGIESLLLKQLILNDRRVCSKTELIFSINRDPELYRGLEMCLSRLQEKFKAATHGERLFRSARNRGYCLVQKIKNTY